jgi:CrcB protein
MAAGAIGSGARYVIGRWVATTIGADYPYGTLLVNLAGCFLLGAVTELSISQSWNPELRMAVAAGFLGGFTTYSSFNEETLTMLSSGATAAAAIHVIVTLAGGLAAGALGMAVARLLRL